MKDHLENMWDESPCKTQELFSVFLNFTEFIADSQLGWALQQHALGAVSKIA